MESTENKYLYVIGNSTRLFTRKHNEIRFIKIGISQDPEKRLKQLQTGCPFPLELIKIFKPENVLEMEQKLHRELSGCSTSGEWFMIAQSNLGNTLGYISKFVKNGGSLKTTPINPKKRYADRTISQIEEGKLTPETMWSIVKNNYRGLTYQERLEIMLPLMKEEWRFQAK